MPKSSPLVARVPPSAARYSAALAAYAGTPPQAVRAALETDMDATRARMERHATALKSAAERFKADGDVGTWRQSVAAWQNVQAAEVRASILSGYALGRGGMGRMTARDFGLCGAPLKTAYTALNVRAKAAFSDPDYVLTGGFVTHAGMYANEALIVFEKVREREEIAAGRTVEINVLQPGAEHCKPSKGKESCAEQTAKGPVPAGTLVKQFQTACGWGCRCLRLRFESEAAAQSYLNGAS